MKSLYIKNFKNIKELSIETLAKVNLIVGKNSVGKSTVLEAISIYLANGNEEWLRQILDNRGETISYNRFHSDSEETAEIIGKHYLSLFTDRAENYNKDFGIVIGEAKTDKDSVRINQIYISEEKITDENGIRIRRVLLSEEDIKTNREKELNISGQGLSINTGNNNYVIPFNRIRPLPLTENKAKFQYVHTIDFNTEKNAILFDKISLSPEEKYIIQALQVINPQISRINYLNNDMQRGPRERIPIVTLTGDNNKYKLSSMGDGINRILTIILAMLNCKNGVMLLDEFETGLHYSVQDELWKIIFMLAEELNIQVFVTSHSNDCINSFVKANKQGNGILIRLENRDNNITAVNYISNNELEFATSNNIEIR